MIWWNVLSDIYIAGEKEFPSSLITFISSLLFRTCVRTHIDVCFKEGKCRFACVESSCPGEYAIPLISELLPPKDFNRLNRRIQEENIRQGTVSSIDHKSLSKYLYSSGDRWIGMLSLLSICGHCR